MDVPEDHEIEKSEEQILKEEKEKNILEFSFVEPYDGSTYQQEKSNFPSNFFI